MSKERPCDFFNAMSPMPDQPIDLGDGRVLYIISWEPVGDMNDPAYDVGRSMPITVKGRIGRKPEKQKKPPKEEI